MPQAHLEKEFVDNLKVMAAKTFRLARKDIENSGHIDWVTKASSIVVDNILAVLLQNIKMEQKTVPIETKKGVVNEAEKTEKSEPEKEEDVVK